MENENDRYCRICRNVRQRIPRVSSQFQLIHLGTPCNQKCAGCRPYRGAMEPRADIPRPSAIGQSRAQQKEPLKDPGHPACRPWEQTGLQQVLDDLRPDDLRPVNRPRADSLTANVMAAGQVCGTQTRPELQSHNVPKRNCSDLNSTNTFDLLLPISAYKLRKMPFTRYCLN